MTLQKSSDESNMWVSRYALPYRVQETANGSVLPTDNGGLFPERPIDAVHRRQDHGGLAVFQNQLFVRDHQRYMVWNDYLSRPDGSPANLFIGQDGGDNIRRRNTIMGSSHHAIDDRNRLWTGCEHGMMILYQLPFTTGAEPLRVLIPLYWADDPSTEVVYHGMTAAAFDPLNRHLWVADGSRLLRVRNPDDWNGKLLVDAIIGQTDKTSNQINRGMPAPDAASLGTVNSIRFDRLGNLFVVDNTYECHPNGRVIAFLAEDLAQISGMFPSIQAKKLYCVERFDQADICRHGMSVDHPFSPVSIAFSRSNAMVIGNDGYHRDPMQRAVRQLYLYRRPLEKSTPDEVIELPIGAPAEMQFDDADNLVVIDATWNRVWVVDVLRHKGADFDGNGFVDANDLSVFEACATGPAIPYDPANLPEPSPGCTLSPDVNGKIGADFDVDGDVDQSDFGVFQRCLSGEGNPADPACTGNP
jgi:hypothetical protein